MAPTLKAIADLGSVVAHHNGFRARVRHEDEDTEECAVMPTKRRRATIMKSISDLGSVVPHRNSFRARVHFDKHTIDGPSRETHNEARLDLHGARQCASRDEMEKFLRSLSREVQHTKNTEEAERPARNEEAKTKTQKRRRTQRRRSWSARHEDEDAEEGGSFSFEVERTVFGSECGVAN